MVVVGLGIGENVDSLEHDISLSEQENYFALACLCTLPVM